MAKYRVIEGFYDLQDPENNNYHLYNVGDKYPRTGLYPTPERIAFLLSASNKLGRPVIDVVPEAVQEPAEEATEEVVENPAEEALESAEEPQKSRKKRG